MGGVCCLHPTFYLSYLKVVFLDNVIKAVVANTSGYAKLPLVHEPKLIAANTWVFLANAFDELYNERLLRNL